MKLDLTLKLPVLFKINCLKFSDQINPENLNLALFTYGSLKHLLFLNNGTLPSVSKPEFNGRIHHLLNTLEIVLLGSSLKVGKYNTTKGS